MVFVLRHVVQGEILVLGPNKTYTLGRSRRNTIHLTDMTVNNNHATLEVSVSHADIEDNDSNFGTWVNKDRISVPFRLRNGDVIVFGKKDCKYVFLDPKFQVQVNEHISNQTKCMLTETLKDLCIGMTEIYVKSSSHYIIETVSLATLKEKDFLYYLIDSKTVITPKYFVDILANINEAPLMPNIYRYMPEIDDYLKSKGIIDINPKYNRRHIFDNMVFIFFDKKYDQELNGLIICCGGETVLHSQKQDFFQELFEDRKEYVFMAVNHNMDGKKSAPMYCFLRSMRRKKRKALLISYDNIYIGILKGNLSGLENDFESEINSLGSKASQPDSSKMADAIVLDSSEDEELPIEPGPTERMLECDKTTKSPKLRNMNNPQSPNTFSRLAVAYKKQKTLRDTSLENLASSSTLHKWITRNKKNSMVKKNRVTSQNDRLGDHSAINRVTTEEPEGKQSANVLRDNDGDETEDYLDINSEDTVNSVLKESISVDSSKGRDNLKCAQEKNKTGDDADHRGRVKKPYKRNNGKRKSLAINPVSLLSLNKRSKEKSHNHSGRTDDWLKKYKNVEIIPMA